MKKGNTTIVPIDDKTLYNKDKKVNGLIKQLSSYTSVQGVSFRSVDSFLWAGLRRISTSSSRPGRPRPAKPCFRSMARNLVHFKIFIPFWPGIFGKFWTFYGSHLSFAEPIILNSKDCIIRWPFLSPYLPSRYTRNLYWGFINLSLSF